MKKDSKPTQSILKGTPKLKMNEHQIKNSTVVHKRFLKQVNPTKKENVSLLEALICESKK